jgi:hypothetical protein
VSAIVFGIVVVLVFLLNRGRETSIKLRSGSRLPSLETPW